MSWFVTEHGFQRERIVANGNKFMIGNGYMGYRGTMEEFGKDELTATTLAGLYDKVGNQWREPVNAPNGLAVKIYCEGRELGVLTADIVEHRQRLDYGSGVHERATVYRLADGHTVAVTFRRFCSASRLHVIAGQLVLQASRDVELVVRTGIDGDVWDINGPHLESFESGIAEAAAGAREGAAGIAAVAAGTGADASGIAGNAAGAAGGTLGVAGNAAGVAGGTAGATVDVTGTAADGASVDGKAADTAAAGATDTGAGATGVAGDALVLTAATHELKVPVSVAETIAGSSGPQLYVREERSVHRELRIHCPAGETRHLEKFAAVYTELDSVADTALAAVSAAREAASAGYEVLLEEHKQVWKEKWQATDVIIEGDAAAQEALRYSMYQLHIIAPEHSERLSIPARGLSGQVYKGAVFWDTEMFMLPFFLHTRPEIARNLMMYRVHTLDGARRKAAEYGFEGAFYAWESQESGDDACTLFNVNDVFTGRPMRTYFRDKQVHISADVAHGIWQYYTFTGDDSLLTDGGAEVVWECARFFYSYAYYNSRKRRYEILDVTGPDEYHERVNNNAFTNKLVQRTLRIALDAMEALRLKDAACYERLLASSETTPDHIRHMHDRLYVPAPNETSLLIEQFDRCFTLEDVSLPELKSRVLNDNEYLGGGSGLATTTQILKQADVVLMLHLFKDQYDHAVKQANWTYYEPRTEHGSSLSSCIYAIVAADIGSPDWAYPYFLRTATIDLTGDSKQYVGDLYIGGTHPAANGGAWMAAVLGFAGLHYDGERVRIRPSLPEQWTSVQFPLTLQGQSFRVTAAKDHIAVAACGGHSQPLIFEINGKLYRPEAGQELYIKYG